MHLNVLSYLLIFGLITKNISNSDSLQGAQLPYILNEVSDFNDIVEKEYQSGPNLQLKEDSELPQSDSLSGDHRELNHNQPSYETLGDDLSHGSVFSYSVLSASDSNKENVCPKHDIRHRDSAAATKKLFKLQPQDEEVEDLDQEKAQMVRLLPKQGEHNDFETAQTVIIKENSLPSRGLIVERIPENKELVATAPFESNTNIPDYVYDFDNANEDESCKNCDKVKGLFPIPLLESVLINKLLETNDKSKPYPIKYIVKSVMPNVQNVEELDKPKTQQCLKSYLHRRKRQLQYLKKRSAKHKKQHKKKKKRKNQSKKSRHHRSANDTVENELNGMVAYVAKNQTFNDTFTYMPLLFGTVAPAEGQMLVAGVKHDASPEEKFMLQKILSIKPDDISNHNNITTASLQQLAPCTQASGESTLTTHVGNPPTQESVKYNLNLNLNSPEVKKTFMEIMQRQQNIENYDASTNKVKRQAVLTSAVTPPIVASSAITPATIVSAAIASKPTESPPSALPALPPSAINNSTSTEAGALGLVVTSPASPNGAHIVPGILIYPKSPKRKRYASDLSAAGINNIMLNQADINTILKSIDTSENEKADAYLEAPKSKKQCKTDKCTDETDKIMDALNNLNHPPEELVFQESLSSSMSSLKLPAIGQPNPADSNNYDQLNADLKQNPEMRDKLSKLQKDLKMVKEIQHIFDGVANAKKLHQKEKRNVLIKSLRKTKLIGSEPEENKYESELSGLIKARMWQKNNKSYCEDKVKRQYLGKKRSRRFLARG